jgi:hypothetical protein
MERVVGLLPHGLLLRQCCSFKAWCVHWHHSVGLCVRVHAKLGKQGLEEDTYITRSIAYIYTQPPGKHSSAASCALFSIVQTSIDHGLQSMLYVIFCSAVGWVHTNFAIHT